MVAHARLRDSQRLGSTTADPGEISLVMNKIRDLDSEQEDGEEEGERSFLDKHNTNRAWMDHGSVEPSAQFAQV